MHKSPPFSCFLFLEEDEVKGFLSPSLETSALSGLLLLSEEPHARETTSTAKHSAPASSVAVFPEEA